MLKKISAGILKYKGIILFVVGLLFAVAVVGTVFLAIDETKINSDVSSYLAEDSQTKSGLNFLEEKFDIRGYATLVVRVDEKNGGKELLQEKIDKLLSDDQITQITWYGSLEIINGIEGGAARLIEILAENEEYLTDVFAQIKDADIYENIGDFQALLSLASYYQTDLADTSEMENQLRIATSEEGVFDYVLLIMLATDGTGDSSYALLDSIKNEFSYTEYASAGTVETGERLLRDTMEDLPWFILAGVAIVLIILFLTTSSWIEPFIMLLTLLIGIVISMGMNYLFPSVSIISFAVSAVLQLAITMDYSVFYMHLYRGKRAQLEPTEATVEALPEAMGSILAGGLTTVGGFAALYCMRFGIGADIANVLIKGIVLSMLTVLTVQPILTFLLDKQITKTTHVFRKKSGVRGKEISKEAIVRPVGKFSVWARIGIIVITAALIVPCYLGQSHLNFSYLELYEKKSDTEEERIANDLGNELILAVPYQTVNGGTHARFIEEVKAAGGERVSSVLGVFSALNVDEKTVGALLEIALNSENVKIDQLKTVLESGKISEYLSENGVQIGEPDKLNSILNDMTDATEDLDVSGIDAYFRECDGEWYTLYTISFTGNAEDAEAQAVFANIENICTKYFGKGEYHSIGMVTSGYEMAQITPGDFLRVTLVSVAIIFLIVAFLLKNPLKSLIVVALIEIGIWLNLSISYLAGDSINFIVYIIISSVELGCTVDYAILYANTFEKNRSLYATGKECAVETEVQTVPAIMTSALMIVCVGLSMYFISGNIVIKQLVGVLARGAAISFVLVLLCMPAIWSFFPTRGEKNADPTRPPKYKKPKKSIEEKLKELEEAEKQQNV